MQLNMIRDGIRIAVEEGIKSERTKVELITNVSHDIKTPLTSIISYIELMKTEPNLPPHMQDYLKIVSQKADRLRHMLQDIFDVSKAATGNITLMPEYIGLDKLLRQTLGDMDGVMNDSELTWRVQIPQEDFPVYADGQRMYRVFQNLIKNAAQYACLCAAAKAGSKRRRDNPEYLEVRAYHGRRFADGPLCARG